VQAITIKRVHAKAGEKSTVSIKAAHARHFFSRLRGLLGKSGLAKNEGLLITPCNQVHTLGMRFAIDVVFLDKQGCVLRCVSNLKPNRLAAASGARHTLELAAGSISEFQLSDGDNLTWTPVPQEQGASHYA